MFMKKLHTLPFFVIIIFVTIFFNYSNAQNSVKSESQNGDWKLLFEDNFDGSSVNTSNWYIYNSGGHNNNGLRRPSAFTVANGQLIVTAQMINGALVSGGMANSKSYTYGKFEFRVCTEADPSSATSGVVLTWPQSEKWPSDGENDIYETTTSANRSPFKTFIHYGTSASTQYEFTHQADAKVWHIMAMEWAKDSLKIYRDGVMVYKLTDVNAIPDVPHHLCIQLDAFKTSMTGIVKMYVDWVKIYQWDNSLTDAKTLNTPTETIQISPNPVSDYLNIKYPDSYKPQEIDIYSIDGKVVKSYKGMLSRIDCSNLNKGIYFLHVKNGFETNTIRFIKI